MPACEECGSTARVHANGVAACGECGAIPRGANFEFPTWVPRSSSLARVSVPLRVEARPHHIKNAQQLLWRDTQYHHRIQRTKAAIDLLGNALAVSESTRELAVNLALRHCRRLGQCPAKGPRLKALVSGAMLIASVRQGLGVTIGEVAVRAGIDVNVLKRNVWKICKLNGFRMIRTQKNVESLLERMCEHFKLTQQRGAVCDAGVKIYAMACRGWVNTGRMWALVVAAAFVLSARAYYYHVKVAGLAKLLAASETTIQKRVGEIEKMLVGLLHLMPWGFMVTPASLHLYMRFLLDFWEIILPLAPELRRLKMEREALEAESRPALDGRRGRSTSRPRAHLKPQNAQAAQSSPGQSQSKADTPLGDVPAAQSGRSRSRSQVAQGGRRCRQSRPRGEGPPGQAPSAQGGRAESRCEQPGGGAEAAAPKKEPRKRKRQPAGFSVS